MDFLFNIAQALMIAPIAYFGLGWTLVLICALMQRTGVIKFDVKNLAFLEKEKWEARRIFHPVAELLTGKFSILGIVHLLMYCILFALYTNVGSALNIPRFTFYGMIYVTVVYAWLGALCQHKTEKEMVEFVFRDTILNAKNLAKQVEEDAKRIAEQEEEK